MTSTTPRKPLQFNEIAAEIAASAAALKDEVDTVDGLIDGRELERMAFRNDV